MQKEVRKMKRLLAFVIILMVLGCYSFSFADETVKKAQKILIERGYNPGVSDGIFGKRTEDAIKEFQKDNGLQITGNIDNETINIHGLAGDKSRVITPKKWPYSRKKEEIWRGGKTTQKGRVRIDDFSSGKLVLSGKNIEQTRIGFWYNGYQKYFRSLTIKTVNSYGNPQELYIEAKKDEKGEHIYFTENSPSYNDPKIKSPAEIIFREGDPSDGSSEKKISVKGRLSDGTLEYIRGEGNKLSFGVIVLKGKGLVTEVPPMNSRKQSDSSM